MVEKIQKRDLEMMLDAACRENKLSRAQAKLKLQREGTSSLALLHINTLMILLKYEQQAR